MTNNKYINQKSLSRKLSGISCKNMKQLYLSFVIILLAGCSDFVDVDLPRDQLASESIFAEASTADAAIRDIYGKMRDNGLVSGGSSGLGNIMGLYTDELTYFGQPATPQEQFQNHSVLPIDPVISSWWNNAYSLIYAANSVIEGVENSQSLEVEDVERFKGEGLFIRAFLHLLLVEIYGDIPYITTSDFRLNSTVSRIPEAQVYEDIIDDLIEAKSLLPLNDFSGERIRPYKFVADALLAKAYLYNMQWEQAEARATLVIDEFGILEPNLDNVFLKDATSTIMQLKPESEGVNTFEGRTLIFLTGPPPNQALSQTLFQSFEIDDERRLNWIAAVTDGTDTWYHPFKYKQQTNTPTSLEFSILFRLAEQYLIRAEARAQLGDISGAQQDLNAVRNRAGLENTSAVSSNDLLDAILRERQLELFTEFGNRWFDLKRFGQASEVLSPIKPGWQESNILLPLPQDELLLNPNLEPQNPGY